MDVTEPEPSLSPRRPNLRTLVPFTLPPPSLGGKEISRGVHELTPQDSPPKPYPINQMGPDNGDGNQAPDIQFPGGQRLPHFPSSTDNDIQTSPASLPKERNSASIQKPCYSPYFNSVPSNPNPPSQFVSTVPATQSTKTLGRGMYPPTLNLPTTSAPVFNSTLHNPFAYQVNRGPVLSNIHHPGAPLSVIGGALPAIPPDNGHLSFVIYQPGERPFKCDKCPQSFSRNHDLKRHKRIHIAVKVFPCLHCDKSYSRKDALKRHKLVGCAKSQEDRLTKDKFQDPGSTRIPPPQRDLKLIGTSMDSGNSMESWRSIDNGYAGLGGEVSEGPDPWQIRRTPGFGMAINDSSKMQAPPLVAQEAPVTTDTMVRAYEKAPGQSRQQVVTNRSCSPSETGRSQSSSSTESNSVSGESLMAERKRQVVDRIVHAATTWLRSKFALTRCVGHQRQGSSSTARGIPESGGSRSSTWQANHPGRIQNEQGQRKRKATDNEDDEEQNRPNQPPPKTRKGKGKEIPIVQFACPYFKYNKIKYKSWRGCPGPGWPDVHRVKEHLYRRHRRPRYRCGRCWQPFDEENSHIEHQRIDPPCPVQPFEPTEGFDAEQEKRLKSRKRAITELGEFDKWKHVFRILFPHVDEPDIPSPFYDDESDLHPNSLSECEEYIVKEVPLRLRRIIEPELDRDLSIVEQGLKRKAIDSLKTLLVEAFREFRQLSWTTQVTSGSSAGPSACPQQSDHRSVTRDVGASTSASMYSGETNYVQYQETAMTGQSEDHISLAEVGFEDDLDMAGLDLDFLTNPESFLGEGPFIETLLQPPEISSSSHDDPADKRFSDSGYDSNSNSPSQARRGISET